MGYGRLTKHGSTESIPSVVSDDIPQPPSSSGTKHSHHQTNIPSTNDARGHPPATRTRLYLAIISAVFLLVAVACAAALLATRHRSSGHGPTILPKPTQAIQQACSLTQYQTLCITSLLEFPGAVRAVSRKQLVPISVNMTLQRVTRALGALEDVSSIDMGPQARSAYDGCVELMEDALGHLARSLASIDPERADVTVEQRGEGEAASVEDVVTWLSAALTNQDTCTDDLDGVPGGEKVKEELTDRLKDLNELLSNALAIYALTSDDTTTTGQNNNRKLLMTALPDQHLQPQQQHRFFPHWVGKLERHLLDAPASEIQADYIVSKGEAGHYWSINDAIKAVPEKSTRRIVIYIKAGRYEENVKVSRKMTNLMFLGDGKGKTIITSSRSVQDKYTTFHTATFASTGAGFIARDITFENTAGPQKHQAVALRVGADHSVIYRCEIRGYQDTLYVHSLRQFYRECDIHGTVDFVFGNAAVVLQNCSLYARKPMDQQKCTITAQNRKDPNQNTGISVHDSQVLPAPDLAAAKGAFQTFLGRPWKMYSRVVFMMSYMEDHIDPAGWLPWNGDFALRTLYYGEYKNYGPGAAVGKRVNWPGYRVITMSAEADKFTVNQLIGGSSWLPSTGVAYQAGLTRR